MSAEELEAQSEDAEAALAAAPGDVWAGVHRSRLKYAQSMHVLGENSLANALALGYLDARALYPDLPRYSLEEFAEYYYGKEEPGEYALGMLGD